MMNEEALSIFYDRMVAFVIQMIELAGSELTSMPTLLELGLVLFTVLIAFTLKRFTRGLVKLGLRKIAHVPSLLRFRNAVPALVFPFYLMIFLMLTQAALTVASATSAGPVRVALALVTAWVLIRLFTGLFASSGWSRTLAAIVWTVTALNILRLLDPVIAILDSVGVTIGESRITIYAVMKAIALIFVLLWIATNVSRLLQRRIESFRELSPSVRLLISQITKFLLVALAIVISLNSVGIDLTALAFLGGAIGVGIGFGLQKIVSNIVSGFILLSDRSLKPGDVIEVGDSFGWVNSFGARYTSVVTRDGTEHLIPNETLVTQPVTNWSYTSDKIRRRIPIGISYDSDIDKATELMLEAAFASARVLEDPAPQCRLIRFGDNAIEFELRVWISDPVNGVANVADEVLRYIWKTFKENNINIPFPQRDIHIKSGKLESM